MKNRPVFFLMCFALLLTLAVGIYASYYSKEYYTHIAYRPDPLSGLSRAELAYYNIEANGRYSTLADEFQKNYRDFFSIGPQIILAPSLLLRPDAHLFLAVPLIFLFVLLLGYCTYLRTRNIVYGFVVMLFYISCYAVSEPSWGIGFHMPDTIAGYPAGIAAICLMIWSDEKKTRWLVLFSIFLSISVLIRYIFSVYTFLLFAPPLALLLFQQYKKSKDVWKEILKPILTIGIIVAAVCGYYIMLHSKTNVEYYSYWSHSEKEGTMNVSIYESAKAFLYVYGGFLRKIHGVFLFGLFALNIFLFNVEKKIFRQRLIIALWIFLILPFYWVVILTTNGLVLGSAFMAAFPVMFASLVLPLKNTIFEKNKKWFSLFLLITIAASIIDFSITIKKNSDFLVHAYPVPEPRKNVSVYLADWINRIEPRDCTLSLSVFSGIFLGEDISLESFYRNGRYIRAITSENNFSAYERFWKHEYPNTDVTVIENSIFQNTNRLHNLLLFFKNQTHQDTSGLDNPLSQQVERGLYEKFSTDSKWKMVPVTDSSIGSMVLFYRNYLTIPQR